MKIETIEVVQKIDERLVLGKEFRVYGDFENPMFLAKDVAEWIEYSEGNTAHMLKTIDEDEKVKLFCSLHDGNNVTKPVIATGSANRLFVTEDGLYEVLMQSRKPIAKQFKKEVKKILKQIRKTGGYIPVEAGLSDAEIMARALQISQRTIEQKDKIIEAQKPKVLFADAVTASKTSILVGELAKLLKQNNVDMGQNRLFAWMRDNGYLIKRKGTDYNMPSQYSMERELFEVKENVINHSDGHISVSKTPKVTGKGQLYFINKFKGNSNEE